MGNEGLLFKMGVREWVVVLKYLKFNMGEKDENLFVYFKIVELGFRSVI